MTPFLAPIRLDERLRAVADLFPRCVRGADIGADHGKLSAWLLESGATERMVVSDISEPALRRARELMEKRGLMPRVTLKAADGFDALDEGVEAAAVCGMGGKTIADMMPGLKKTGCQPRLVLSAHTDLPALRAALFQNGYHIDGEWVVRARGRYYRIMEASPGKSACTRREMLTGVFLKTDDARLMADYSLWRVSVEARKRPVDEELMTWLREDAAAWRKRL